jgi:hypothetical protein
MFTLKSGICSNATLVSDYFYDCGKRADWLILLAHETRGEALRKGDTRAQLGGARGWMRTTMQGKMFCGVD